MAWNLNFNIFKSTFTLNIKWFEVLNDGLICVYTSTWNLHILNLRWCVIRTKYKILKSPFPMKYCHLWQHRWILRYHAKWNKSDGTGQKPYDFTHKWYIKQKATNETNKLIDTDNGGTREEGGTCLNIFSSSIPVISKTHFNEIFLGLSLWNLNGTV